MRQETLSGWICTKFGLGGPLADVINCAEFCCSRLRGFDSVGGQNSPSPIGRLPLTQCWRYGAARDNAANIRPIVALKNKPLVNQVKGQSHHTQHLTARSLWDSGTFVPIFCHFADITTHRDFHIAPYSANVRFYRSLYRWKLHTTYVAADLTVLIHFYTASCGNRTAVVVHTVVQVIQRHQNRYQSKTHM